jgi:hypothetical protein
MGHVRSGLDGWELCRTEACLTQCPATCVPLQPSDTPVAESRRAHRDDILEGGNYCVGVCAAVTSGSISSRAKAANEEETRSTQLRRWDAADMFAYYRLGRYCYLQNFFERFL